MKNLNRFKKIATSAACLPLILWSAGCTSSSARSSEKGGAAQHERAVADMQARSGSNVTGSIKLIPIREGGVHLIGKIKGLGPGSVHALHVHEKGDCSAQDAESAGGHFDPEGVRHGKPGTEEHHAGDLGNFKSDKDGAIPIDVTFPHLNLSSPNDSSILNRALVLHSDADDFRSQPAGDAGARLACGVIKKSL